MSGPGRVDDRWPSRDPDSGIAVFRNWNLGLRYPPIELPAVLLGIIAQLRGANLGSACAYAFAASEALQPSGNGWSDRRALENRFRSRQMGLLFKWCAAQTEYQDWIDRSMGLPLERNKHDIRALFVLFLRERMKVVDPLGIVLPGGSVPIVAPPVRDYLTVQSGR